MTDQAAPIPETPEPLEPCALCDAIVTVHENDWCEPPEYNVMCAHPDGVTISSSGADKRKVIESWNAFNATLDLLAVKKVSSLEDEARAIAKYNQIHAIAREIDDQRKAFRKTIPYWDF